MASLSYSFCMSMLHSFWQAGLLLLLYTIVNRLFLSREAALEKRNFLFAAIGTQVVLFVVTFSIYYLNTSDSAAEGSLNAMVAPLLSADITHAAAPWLFAVYSTVIVFKILKAVYTWHRFKQYYRTGLQKPQVDLKLFTQLKAHHLGIKRKVTLWLSHTVSTPVTFGFFKPVILLPVALVNQINLQQAETLILHELSHIRVNDYLLNWFLIAAETVFFFNPFVLSFCKAIRMEREKYCDSTVISFNYPAALYAETLLQAERLKQAAPGFQLAAVSKKKQLLQRIQFFTDERNFSGKRQRQIVAPLIGAVAVLAFVAALFFNLPLSKKEDLALAVIPAGVDVPVIANTEAPPAIHTAALTENAWADQAEKIATSVQPVIEKQLKDMEPLLRSLQEKAEALADDMEQTFATPVAIVENNATRQIVVKEEQSGSKGASVKVYELRFENGQWVVQPEWMASVKEKLNDSLRKIIDTSVEGRKVLHFQ